MASRSPAGPHHVIVGESVVNNEKVVVGIVGLPPFSERATADAFERWRGVVGDPLAVLFAKVSDGGRAGARNPTGVMPYAVILWYQGGRVEVFNQFEISTNHRNGNFHTWAPGKDGWVGFCVRAAPGTAPLVVRIDTVVLD